jgi:nucleotide-binding universal stress UspA family protein
MLPLQIILHPTDFSERSSYAFRLACSLARDHGARVLVLHVVTSLGPEEISYGEAVSELQPEGHQRRLWAELRQVRSPDPAVPLEHQLVEGEPADEIVRVAQETGCDLVVLGTHGRTGLDRLLMGSVAEQVVRRAPCPVLTVRMPPPSV